MNRKNKITPTNKPIAPPIAPTPTLLIPPSSV
jgi:hypothetical protein